VIVKSQEPSFPGNQVAKPRRNNAWTTAILCQIKNRAIKWGDAKVQSIAVCCKEPVPAPLPRPWATGDVCFQFTRGEKQSALLVK